MNSSVTGGSPTGGRATGGSAVPDAEEPAEEAGRTPPPVPGTQTSERGQEDAEASAVPPPLLVISPLTGATPVLAVPPPPQPFASPLTGATAIWPGPASNQTGRPSVGGSSAGGPNADNPSMDGPSAGRPNAGRPRAAVQAPPIVPLNRPPGRDSNGDEGGSAPLVRDDGVAIAERTPDPATGSGPAAGRRARRPAAGPAVRPSGPLCVRALGAATVEVGGTALTAADWGYAKPRELLFLLITSPPLTREQLGAALWPELARAQLGNALHTALREVRRALGAPDWVIYAAGRYSVNRDRAFECDVDTFESSLAAAGRARPASTGLPDLRRAIAAYGGDFLAGMTTGGWAHARRDELRRRFETALLATGRLQMAAGNYLAAVTVFRRAVEHEPLNESAHRDLMTCWARLGQPGRAVRHYTELTALLRERVGIAPAAETTALYQRLTGRA